MVKSAEDESDDEWLTEAVGEGWLDRGPAESVVLSLSNLLNACLVDNRPPTLPELDPARQAGADAAADGFPKRRALANAGKVVDILWDGTTDPLDEERAEALTNATPTLAGRSARALVEELHGPHEPWWRYREFRQTVVDAVAEGYRASESGEACPDHAAEIEALDERFIETFLGCLDEQRLPTYEEREPTRRYAKRVRVAYKEADAILGHMATTLVSGIRADVALLWESAADEPGPEASPAEAQRVIGLLEARLREDMGLGPASTPQATPEPRLRSRRRSRLSKAR